MAKSALKTWNIPSFLCRNCNAVVRPTPTSRGLTRASCVCGVSYVRANNLWIRQKVGG